MTNQFHPSELTGADAVQPTTAELGQSLLIARELESLLATTDVHPSDRFVDRVMSAVVAQPRPQPAMAAGLALRGGRFGAMLAALADNWRITFSGDHPFPVRAQALAFVLVAALAVGSLGGVAAIGAVRLLGPAPSVAAPAPTQQGPVAQPSPTPALGPIVAPTEGTPEPTETPEATETPEPTSGQGPMTPRGTAKPSDTEEPKETDEPKETEEPRNGHGGDGGHGDGGSPD